MTLRLYLLCMTASTVLAWLAWSFVIFNVRPIESGATGLLLFYVTLLVSLIGSLTLFGLIIRMYMLNRQDVVSREVKTSFRHALLLSFVGILSLFLSRQGIFRYWIFLLLIAVVALFEYVALTVQQSRRG